MEEQKYAREDARGLKLLCGIETVINRGNLSSRRKSCSAIERFDETLDIIFSRSLIEEVQKRTKAKNRFDEKGVTHSVSSMVIDPTEEGRRI